MAGQKPFFIWKQRLKENRDHKCLSSDTREPYGEIVIIILPSHILRRNRIHFHYRGTFTRARQKLQPVVRVALRGVVLLAQMASFVDAAQPMWIVREHHVHANLSNVNILGASLSSPTAQWGGTI